MNTMQQEFDAVVAHLYKQGRPAKTTHENGASKCCYRLVHADTTLMCAVGCRIPDAVYSSDMDISLGVALHAILKNYGGVLPVEMTVYREMFTALQAVHDDDDHSNEAFDFDLLEEQLGDVAERFDLTFTVPQAA